MRGRSGDGDGGTSAEEEFTLSDAAAECADAAAAGRWRRAEDLGRQVHERASPDGDYVERAVVQFVAAIASAREHPSRWPSLPPPPQQQRRDMVIGDTSVEEEMRRAFLAFNQAAPFVRFAHLTANQAILETVVSERRRGSSASPPRQVVLHILDVEIMEGVQWPPLMQALGEEATGVVRVRLWGGGRRRDELEAVGGRLEVFARTVRLGLEYRAVEGEGAVAVVEAMAEEVAEEDAHEMVVVAINCMVMMGGTMGGEAICRGLARLARAVRAAVVTVGEREMAAAGVGMGGGARAVLESYCAMFEAMEVTLPPTSEGRVRVERVWLRTEMERWWAATQVGGDAASGWLLLLESQHGFRASPLSDFALSQARLLLRLHYPADGYRLLHPRPHLLSLGWRQTPLYSVSAWLPPPPS